MLERVNRRETLSPQGNERTNRGWIKVRRHRAPTTSETYKCIPHYRPPVALLRRTLRSRVDFGYVSRRPSWCPLPARNPSCLAAGSRTHGPTCSNNSSRACVPSAAELVPTETAITFDMSIIIHHSAAIHGGRGYWRPRGNCRFCDFSDKARFPLTANPFWINNPIRTPTVFDLASPISTRMDVAVFYSAT